MPDSKRIFSEQEIAALVRRAIELQEQQKDSADYTPGVTEEELRRVAGELGVDPKYLDQAIREGLTAQSKKGPLHLTEEFERVVDVELRPEDFDIVMSELKSVARRHPISQVGRTLTGQTWTGWSFAGVEINSRNGRTKIKVRSTGIFAWLVTLHPATLAAFILLPALGAKGLVFPAIGVAAGLLTAAFVGFKALLKKGHEAARKLTDRLATRIVEEGPTLRENLARSEPNEISQEEPPQQVETT